jgi:hypothetical protein
MLELEFQPQLIATKHRLLLVCRNKYGPIFGGGNYIIIGDYYNSGLNSCCRFDAGSIDNFCVFYSC